jgi:hypothetical protein
MHHTADAIRAQKHLVRCQRRNSDCLGMFNLLTSDAIFDELEHLLPVHRDRCFPPTEALAMLVSWETRSSRAISSSLPYSGAASIS